MDRLPRKGFFARIWGPRQGDGSDRASRDTVLIVDDSRTMIYALQRMLEPAGYATLTAYDGVEAVEAAKRRNPELILMDIVMPRMNGFEATRALIADPRTRHIPIIIVSASDQASDRLWGARLGAKAFLAKPIQKKELLDKVGATLALARHTRDLNEPVTPDVDFNAQPREKSNR